MFHRHAYPAALVIVLALVWAGAGCGSSGEPSKSSPSTTRDEAASTPSSTKTRFIREADAICDAMDKEQDAAVEAFLSTHPEGTMSKAMEDAFTRIVGLRPVLTEAEELTDLSPPSGDEQKVGEIIQGIENAVAEAEKNPSSILKRVKGPFAEVDSMSEDYGFKVCSSAL